MVNTEKSVAEYIAIIQALEAEVAALRVELAQYRRTGAPPPPPATTDGKTAPAAAAAGAGSDSRSTTATTTTLPPTVSGSDGKAIPAAAAALLVLPSQSEVVSELSRRVAEYEAELQSLHSTHAVFKAKVDLTEREYLARIESLSALTVAQSMDAAAAAAAAAGGATPTAAPSATSPVAATTAAAAASNSAELTSLRSQVSDLTDRNRELEAALNAARASAASAAAASGKSFNVLSRPAIGGAAGGKSGSQTMQLTAADLSGGVGANGVRSSRASSSAAAPHVSGGGLIRRTVNLGVVNSIQNEAQTVFDRFKRSGTAAQLLQRSHPNSTTGTLLAGALSASSSGGSDAATSSSSGDASAAPTSRGQRSMSVSAMLDAAGGGGAGSTATPRNSLMVNGSGASGGRFSVGSGELIVTLSADEKRAIESKLRHQMSIGVRRVSVNAPAADGKTSAATTATPTPSSKQLTRELEAELKTLETMTGGGSSEPDLTATDANGTVNVPPAQPIMRRRSSAILPPNAVGAAVRRSSRQSELPPPVGGTTPLKAVTEERPSAGGSGGGDSKHANTDSDSEASDGGGGGGGGSDSDSGDGDDTALASSALSASEEATNRRLNTAIRRTGIPDLKQGRDYFCLTVAAILQQALDQGIITDTRHELWAFELFEVCLDEQIPFSQWHVWTQQRIAKIIIERRKQQQQTTQPAGGGGPSAAGAGGGGASGGAGRSGAGPIAAGGSGRGAAGAGGAGGAGGAAPPKKDDECTIM